jgi:6-phosphogluconolactonase
VAESERPARDATPTLVVDAKPFERAGDLLAEALEEVLAERGRVRLAIPGGSALETVRRAQLRIGRSWRRVWLTWVDERCVPVADEGSNRGAAARRGLLTTNDGSEGASGAACVLPLFEDGETPTEAVARVEHAWKQAFGEGLDVVCLGMGADGHVASLFPASRSMPTQGWVAHVADSPKPPPSRITLTRAALATARRIVLVAAGEEKRAAVARLLEGDPALPAHGLRGMVVVTDRDPG